MFNIIFRILSISGKYRNKIIIGLIANLFKSFFISLMIFALFLVIYNIKHLSYSVIFWSVGIMIISIIGKYFTQLIVYQNLHVSFYRLYGEKRLEIGNNLKKAPMGFFNNSGLGQMNYIITTIINDLEEFSSLALDFLVDGYFQAIMISIFLLFFNVPIALISITAIIIALIIMHFVFKVTGKNNQRYESAIKSLSSETLEYINGLSIIRTYNKGNFTEKKFNEACNERASVEIAITNSNTWLLKLYEFVFKFASTAIVVSASLMFLYGYINIYYCLLFIISAFFIYQQLELMGNGAFLAQTLNTKLNLLESITNIPSLDDNATNISLNNYDIELKDVSFSYQANPNKISGTTNIEVIKNISNVNLNIPFKSSLAIVGPSGSGKTTLCNLIARFWDVDSGSISLGGHNLKSFTVDSLLTNISMVFQNVYLFNDTILNNIRFGNQQATPQQVIDACKKAQCHDFIMKLPYGYNTIIGEGGNSLSGGEKQRISIARAILKDAPIIILDEATASIDFENEALLLQALKELTKDKTLITIAHRIETIKNADCIIVMNKGQIVQKGTHQQLLNQEGIYKNFIHLKEQAANWKITD